MHPLRALPRRLPGVPQSVAARRPRARAAVRRDGRACTWPTACSAAPAPTSARRTSRSPSSSRPSKAALRRAKAAPHERIDAPALIVTASPHLSSQRLHARASCGTWWASLVPVIAAAAWFFGVSALLVIAAATLGAVLDRARRSAAAARSPTARRRSPDCCSGSRCRPACRSGWRSSAARSASGSASWSGAGSGQNVFNPALRRPRVPAGRVPGGDHHLAHRRRLVLGAQGRSVRLAVHAPARRRRHLGHAARPAEVRGQGHGARRPRDRQHRRLGRRDGGARDPRRRRATSRCAGYLNWRIPVEHPAHRGRVQRASST